MTEQPNVYIRSLKDREVVEAIAYNEPLTQRTLDRLVRGLLVKIDTSTHFVDSSEVDVAIAKRRR
jgi:hypothetical protein